MSGPRPGMRPASGVAAADASPSEWQGQFCGEASPSARLVNDAAAWEALWNGAMGAPAPAVDFGRHFAAAVFLGSRNTGGYGVEFLEPRTDGLQVVLPYRVRGPGRGSFVIQAFTQPYAVRLFRRTGLKVSLMEER